MRLRHFETLQPVCPVCRAPGTSGTSLEIAKVLREDGGHIIDYVFDTNAERAGIASLLRRMGELGIGYKDLNTSQSSLEDIFVSLVSGGKGNSK